FAEPSLVTGDRETTNVPVQALYLMNSPFVANRAKALAKRLTSETADDQDRIRRAFWLCYSRPPTADELATATTFLQQAARAVNQQTALAALCQGVIAAAEFRNLD